MSGSHPGPHPEPPADLPSLRLPIVRRDGPWFRIHKARYEPLHFGSSGRNRFDAPSQQYGVLYAGDSIHCAFIEAFNRSTGVNIITVRALAECLISRIDTDRPLLLVDLSGSGLARIRADARLFAGDHEMARRWSLALWEHPTKPDGVYYRARHDPSRFCAAIFGRAKDSLKARLVGGLLEPVHSRLLADVLDTYGFGLIDG